MAKRPTRQPRQRPLMRRLTRGPTLLAAAISGAVAAVAVIVVVSLVTQGGGSGSAECLDNFAVERRTSGSEDAPVTIREFSDYQCPHCATYALTTAKQIEEEYVTSGLVRVETRYMAFMGQESVLAAMAAECASEQGRFSEYHEMLFEKQRGVDNGAFSIDRLKRFAGDLELNQEEFDQCLDTARYEDIRDETDCGRDAGVSSTPTLFIQVTGSDDHEFVKGAKSFADLQEIIEEKLQEAAAAAAAP